MNLRKYFPFIRTTTTLAPNQAKETTNSNKKVGLCLSGGGALGFSHIGVIRALEEYNIYPQYISGASMGAIIGTMYAAGYSPQNILQIIKEEHFDRLIQIITPARRRNGFFSLNVLKNMLKKYVPKNDFDELAKKMFISVTNMTKGNTEIIHQGNQLKEFVCASASIPIAFEAQMINNNCYADGGILNNLPIEPLKETCDVIIAADCLQYPKEQKIKDKLDALNQFILLINSATHRSKKPECDLYISSDGTTKYGFTSFKSYLKLYQIGYRRTIEYLEKNPELVKKAQNSN